MLFEDIKRLNKTIKDTSQAPTCAVRLRRVPTPPKVTTQQVADAAGVTGRTISRWVKLGLLPAPKVVYGARPGKQSFWPPHAPEQARWVRAQIDAGQSWQDVLAALGAGDFTPTTIPERPDSA